VLGYSADPLLAADLGVTHLDLRRGDELPSELSSFDAVISWGGEQSVRDLGRYEYLEQEQECLASAVEAGIPVLGVCLGAQILASALGSKVRQLPMGMHMALAETHLAPAAAADPIFSRFETPFPAVHWHEDCFDAPEGAVELVEKSCPGCAAFRYGTSAWGVQFHPEASLDVLFQWWRRTILQAPADESHAVQVLESAAEEEAAMNRAADLIFRGFIRFAQGEAL
jgi:GMP synthase (glutamine-hydrolysing)